MSWTYEQATGRMSQAGSLLAIGYSGWGEAKNDPTRQNVIAQGPIPAGKYSIGPPIDTVVHGPYVLPLTPYPDNRMYNRSGFLIHGDSVIAPGTASEGCVIMPRFARERIWQSGDHVLEVVPGIVVQDPGITI